MMVLESPLARAWVDPISNPEYGHHYWWAGGRTVEGKEVWGRGDTQEEAIKAMMNRAGYPEAKWILKPEPERCFSFIWRHRIECEGFC